MRTLGEHGLLHRDAMTVNGQTIWENCAGRAELERRGHPAVRSAAGGERRHRGAARQPRAGRRGAQAVGGLAAPDAASRPRGRVREHRALQRAHRRSGARRRRRLRARAQGLRTEGLSRAWRRSATWACRRRCCRQGVTDMVRISDARMSGTAYGTAVLHVVAGSGRRRSARARARRRHDRARRRGAPAARSTSATRSSRAPRRLARAGAGRAARRLRAAVHRARAAGRPGRGLRFSRRLPRPRRDAGVALNRAFRLPAVPELVRG